MRDVIHGLIQAESEAKALVQAARDQGEQLVVEAQKRAQGLLTRSRAETRLQAEKIVESAVNEAHAEKKQCLEKAKARLQETGQLTPATVDQIVQAVVEAICTTPSTPPGNHPGPAKP